jgi:hypothetical protein
MFKSGDFDLPLEAQLKLRVVNDEVDNCKDIESLKENLKGATKLLMSYQHILNRVLREKIEADLAESFGDLKLDNS